jgi:hypothetical protein
MGPRDLPAAASHDRPVFFCVLEDDRLVSRITLEVRNRLGPRPKRRDMTTLEVDIDVKIVPIHTVGSINYSMLFP